MQEYYSMNDPNDPKPIQSMVRIWPYALPLVGFSVFLGWGLTNLLYCPNPPLYGCTIQEWVQTDGQPERVLVCPPGVHVDRIYNDVNPPNQHSS